MNTIAQPELLTTTFAVAVEASYDHMRQHNRTTRNQDDYDAGVKMLVKPSICRTCKQEMTLENDARIVNMKASVPYAVACEACGMALVELTKGESR